MPSWIGWTIVAAIGFAALAHGYADAEEAWNRVVVTDEADLRAAVESVEPGTWIALRPGEYVGSFHFWNVLGTESRPIRISADDPADPPTIVGSLQISDAAYVEIADLRITGSRYNGLNIDDGGSYDTPSHHVTIQRVVVTDIAPEGNHDGIKLSGVDDFVVRDSVVEGWGDRGSAIDMVGCHRGLIENNLFRHRRSDGSSGVQAKGGSRAITIRRNRFIDAGNRAVNIGGSTGFAYFRPPLPDVVEGEPRLYEAAEIVVEGNLFIGSSSPIAFTGVDGAVVRFNTLYLPQRWALRILQETRDPRFVPSRNGVFTDNLIVFRTDRWASGGVNIGGGTAPETFVFARNWWYALDDPASSRPNLPTRETDGVYGVSPGRMSITEDGLEIEPTESARHVGAHAFSVRD